MTQYSDSFSTEALPQEEPHSQKLLRHDEPSLSSHILEKAFARSHQMYAYSPQESYAQPEVSGLDGWSRHSVSLEDIVAGLMQLDSPNYRPFTQISPSLELGPITSARRTLSPARNVGP